MKNNKKKTIKNQEGLESFKHIKKWLYLLILYFSFNGCSVDTSLDSIVENEYEKCVSKGNCVIDFSQVLNFEWDNLYCFDEGISSNAVSKAIGFNYLGDKDLSRLILFTKNKQIVYEQKQAVNYNKPNKIDFYGDEYNYTTSNAKFQIEKDKERNIYLLTHIK